MLTDPKEIECVKSAREAGIANPERSREHFQYILECFFSEKELRGKKLLDLGPGHYDFGELARDSGANVVGLEVDPAVVELGKLKGFEVIEGDVYDLTLLQRHKATFDGLFCRGSINSRNFENTADHLNYLQTLVDLVRPGGWLWISPCNDEQKTEGGGDSEYIRIIEEQIAFFREADYVIYADDTEMISAFGIFSDPPRLIFTKGIEKTGNEVRRMAARVLTPDGFFARLRYRIGKLVKKR